MRPRSRPAGRRFQATFYRDPKGSQPVAEYLTGQPARAQVILDNQIDRLNDLGPDNPHLPHPWSSHVRGDLRELRCHVGGDHHRILFARSRNLIVLLHAFPKRTAQLPEAEVRIAEDRWDDFTHRMNAEPRRPPRPAGADAPRRARH